MTLAQQTKLATHLQRLLKVRNVSFPIANTEKGPLYFKHIKDQEGYEIVLDAVPLSMNEYDNRELKSLLEKYLFEPASEILVGNFVAGDKFHSADTYLNGIAEISPVPKKRGRPAGANNKNNGNPQAEGSSE